MSFKAYNELLIPDAPIQNVAVDGKIIGYEFKIQYPSYRGTFLSCIEGLSVTTDGEDVDKSQISFLLNGKQFLPDELSECYKEYWYVLDFATIRVMLTGGLAPGGHDVRVCLRHRIPYTGYFGQYLVLVSDEHKTLTVQG